VKFFRAHLTLKSKKEDLFGRFNGVFCGQRRGPRLYRMHLNGDGNLPAAKLSLAHAAVAPLKRCRFERFAQSSAAQTANPINQVAEISSP
jgi:hypothetical protein